MNPTRAGERAARFVGTAARWRREVGCTRSRDAGRFGRVWEANFLASLLRGRFRLVGMEGRIVEVIVVVGRRDLLDVVLVVVVFLLLVLLLLLLSRRRLLWAISVLRRNNINR